MSIRKFSGLHFSLLSFFFVFFLGVFLSSFFSLEPSFAARGVEDIIRTGGGIYTEPNLPTLVTTQEPEDKVNHLIYSVIGVILQLSGLVAVIFIVIGGARYTMSAGDDDMINGAKSMILYALGGLIVIIFSYAILTNIIGGLEIVETVKE